MSGDTDVTEMATRMASRPNAASGRVILGTMQIKRLQALVYWVKDYDKRGMEAGHELWAAEVMNAAMERKEAEYNYGKLDVDIVDPSKKCQTDFGWDTNWQLAFVNKRNATMGAVKVPVNYVVRLEWDNHDELSWMMTRITRCRLKVRTLGVTTSWYTRCQSRLALSPTPGRIWSFDRTGADGRNAWLSLVGNYNGTGESNKRVERAKEELARLHYKEKVFPFEKYVIKLKETFYVLEKDKHKDLAGKQRVDVLLRGIRSTDPGIMSAKVNVFQSFRGQFDKAAEFMSSLIANMHAAAQLDYANRHENKRRYVSAMGSNDQRGGRDQARQGGRSSQCGGRGNGRGRDGRGRGRMNVVHMRTTSTLLTLTETSLRMSGSDLLVQ